MRTYTLALMWALTITCIMLGVVTIRLDARLDALETLLKAHGLR